MKTVICLIMLSLGVYAMNSKDQIIKNLYEDAADSNYKVTTLQAQSVLKEILPKNFSKEEIINIAKQWNDARKGTTLINPLDGALRELAVAKNTYFDTQKDIDDLRKQITSGGGPLDWVKANWKWLALGAGLLILFPYIKKLFKKD